MTLLDLHASSGQMSDASEQNSADILDVESPSASEIRDGWALDGLDFPSFRISLVAKTIDRLSARSLGRLTGLTMAEWRSLMRIVQARDGLTVRQIAEGAWVDRAEVSRAVKRLESRGLSHRRDNGNDRRAPLLFASQAGIALCQMVVEERSAFHRRAMESFTTQERQMFDTLLLKLTFALDGMNDGLMRS